MKRIYSGLIVLLSVLGISFMSCKKREEPLPVAQDSVAVPVQKFSGSTLHFYNKGYIQWKLKSEQMTKSLSDTGYIEVFPVTLTLFDSLGSERSRVLADSGIIEGSMQSYRVWGNVYIRTRDSMVVRTESLRWFRERKEVESDTFVQIETKKGDVLRGKGLDAVEDFSRFSFKSDVTGEFPNFRERVEQDEEDIFR
ncbi:MAG: LPS export ABC transporter periplasmic protein LptC [Candidatus Pacearchaeota archaeon]|nr:LPS export ABC transporter periplasmic protein LptC [Candidatus Pacearchaeota archaeon]